MNHLFYFLVVASFEHVLLTGDSDDVVRPQTIMSFAHALNAKNRKQQQSSSQGTARKQKDIVDGYFFNSFLTKKMVDAEKKDAYAQVKRCTVYTKTLDTRR